MCGGDPGRLGVCVCARADGEVVSGFVFLTVVSACALVGFACTRDREVAYGCLMRSVCTNLCVHTSRDCGVCGYLTGCECVFSERLRFCVCLCGRVRPLPS